MEQTNGFAPCHTVWHTVPKCTPRVTHPPMWILVVTSVVMMFVHGQTAFAQCPMVCHGSVTVALDADGVYTLERDDLLQNSVANCSGDFEITVTDTLGNVYGSEMNGDFIGEVLTASVLHLDSENRCESDLTVIDNTPPDLECDTLYIMCNVPTNPEELGFPEVSDNVSPNDSITLSYSDVFTDLPCYSQGGDTIVTATIDRTWVAEDESGNTDTCLQKIWFLRATLDMVEFPPHFDGFNEQPLECGETDPYDLDETGRPTINNYPLTNASDCELTTSYLDTEVADCGGQFKIVRTWIIYDLCEDDSRVYTQIILVNDTQAPEIECPAPVTFDTYTNSCLAQVWLPAATASDLCSDYNVTPTWQFGDGYIPYNNVPVGIHEVTYRAVDECGNESVCKINVTVEDDDPPTAICDNQIDITLQSDGTALVFAETFDNGSHDNCGIDYFSVSRDGLPFDEFVYFDCEDLMTPIQVDLKVFDAQGTVSQCVSQVFVNDEIDPEILCPPTSNLDCGTNFSNTDLTGVPFTTDNCEIGATNFSDNINLNACGVGTVLRTWIVTDESGNSASCTQTININDNTPLSIVFPDDITTYECGANTDPSVTGVPIITGTDCENLGIDHTDFEFYTAYPACYQLVRKWAIIEFCSFNPSTGEGFWEHTQIIEVLDNEAPVLSCPSELTIGIEAANGCETYAQIPIPTVEDCSEEITITNNSPYALNTGEDASGIYPKGEHYITFYASDGCGNTTECSMKIVIVDTEPPNPVCNNGVSVTIQQNGITTVTPNMIENGSWDNCSDYSSLVMQVSPNTFTCQTLGTQTVTLTVTDQFGNSAFCQTNVVVQDNFDVCDDIGSVTVAGKMEKASGDALSQKLVGLSGGLSMAQHTNVDGTFAFQGLPTNHDYTITPTYDKEYLNGVTTYDLVLIRKHILNIKNFETPYEWIAADVNNSGTVTTFDMVELRKMILAIQEGFNNNTSWRFIDASYVFQNPNDPLKEDFPEEIYIENVAGNTWGQNFVGVKIGDINGNADPSNFNGDLDDRNSNEELIFNIPDIELKEGNQYEIPFKSNQFEHILGYQFALKIDTESLEFEGVENINLAYLTENNFGLNKLENGILTTSWEAFPEQTMDENESLFTLRLTAKTDGKLSDYLSLNQGIMPAEAYSGSLYSNSDVEFRDVVLAFEETNEREEIQLFQNKPNPFSDETKIEFFLPEATKATLTIHDLLGRVIWQESGTYREGFQQIIIHVKNELVEPGILIYRLDAEGFNPKTGKMIFAK